MYFTLFNIGLSLLSRSQESQKTEAFRIISLFEGRIITDNDIKKEDGGRPYFKREESIEKDFNISHSGDMVAVSYVHGEGLKTGCDIQLVKDRPNALRIAEQLYSPAENGYILKQKEQGNDSAFYLIWVLKECFIKLHGYSVLDMGLKAPCFIQKDGSLNLVHDDASFFLYKLRSNNAQYFLATAIKGGGTAPNIQWFSELQLPLERIDKVVN